MWNHFYTHTLKSGWSDDESFPIWLKFGFMVPFESWFICAAIIFFAVFLSWGDIRRLVAASFAASSGDLSSNTLRAEFPTRLNERLLDFWIRLGSTWAMGVTRCWRLRTEDGDCEIGLRSESSPECCRSWRWERWTTPATGDSLAVRGWCFGASGFGVSVRPRIWWPPCNIINWMLTEWHLHVGEIFKTLLETEFHPRSQVFIWANQRSRRDRHVGKVYFWATVFRVWKSEVTFERNLNF